MAQCIGEEQHAAPEDLFLQGHDGEHDGQRGRGAGCGKRSGQRPQGESAQKAERF